MRRFFKLIGALSGGVIVLAALVLAGLYGYDQYKQNTFKPIEEVDGVYLGMPRGDLLFQTDLKMECDPVEVAAKDCEFYRYGDLLLNSGVLAKGYIRLRNDKVASISRHSEMIRDIANQVYTTDMLRKKLGDPDVLVISPDLTRRAYMYVNEALAFNYDKDSLTSFYWGGMSISDIGISSRKRIPENLRDSGLKFQQTYIGASVIVDDEQICPGETCPFEEGDTFPEFTKMKLYSAEEMRKFLGN